MDQLNTIDCLTCPSASDCGASGFHSVATALRQVGDFIRSAAPPRGATCVTVGTPSANYLRRAAANLAIARRARGQSLPAGLLGEPAWDILLELFAHEGPQSMKAVSIGTCVPLTSTLRWVGLLEREGLVEQFADPGDARRTLVELSEKGIAAISIAVNGIRTAFIEVTATL